jgi:AraC-like DNA-binding protein
MQVADLEPIVIRRLAGEFQRRGLSPERSFAGLGFGLADLMEPSFLVSLAQMQEVVRRAMHQLREPHLGLKLGHSVNPTAWGDCLLGMMASADAHQMLHFAAEFLPGTARPLGLRCEETPQGPCLVAAPVSQDEAFNGFLVEKTFAALAQVVRRLVGPEWGPVAAELALRRPAAAAAHGELLGCPVRFASSEHRLIFPRTPVPLKTSEPVVLERVRRRLMESRRGGTTVPQVEAMVTRMLRGRLGEPPGLPEVAAALNMSERTLRRRLGDTGLSYAALLDRERRAQALALLRGGQLSLGEVALAVGFNDVRSLRRAVRRWSGQSPSQLRRGA